MANSGAHAWITSWVSGSGEQSRSMGRLLGGESIRRELLLGSPSCSTCSTTSRGGNIIVLGIEKLSMTIGRAEIRFVVFCWKFGGDT